MRKVTIIILIVVIAGFIGGVVYLDRKQESESGYRDGLKMGYLYGFTDAKTGISPETDKLGEKFAIGNHSTYEKPSSGGPGKATSRATKPARRGKTTGSRRRCSSSPFPGPRSFPSILCPSPRIPQRQGIGMPCSHLSV